MSLRRTKENENKAPSFPYMFFIPDSRLFLTVFLSAKGTDKQSVSSGC